MKIYYFTAVLLLFVLGGSQAPIRRTIPPSQLTGNISLTLEHGVWKRWNDKPVYQDITLDLACQSGQCQSDVWGYAPKFNQDVDHSGTVQVVRLDNSWLLQVKMNIQFHPWKPQTELASYKIEVLPHQGKLIGSYSGHFNQRSVQGEVQGSISPRWPVPVAYHSPLKPQEHPRLLLRRHQLSALRVKAQTPTGQKLVAHLQQSLQQPVYYEGYVPTGGYHAAGHCFLYQLEKDPQNAQRAWEFVENSMARPGPRLLEQSPIVAGIALAYDLCYEAWDEPRLNRVSRWLKSQTVQLINGDSPSNGWNSNAWSNWSARARGAAGLAALALLDESPNSKHLAKVAERNITRYLTTALGERGFGSEGDHYTTEPWLLGIIPFLVAHRNVTGYDLVPNSSAQWLLPHYITRMVPSIEGSGVPTYGRHRSVAAEALLAAGLPLVPEQFLPGVMWGYQRYLSEQGDKVGGHWPQVPMLALLGYSEETVTRNPAEVWGRVLADQQKGFYVFRNRWQDEEDIVASIYSKRQPLKASWSYPEVGSFRIWGLGSRWAVAGPDNGQPESENAVILPRSVAWRYAEPLFFESRADGSGIVSMKTNTIVRQKNSSSVGINLLRSFAVDFSGASGAPGLFVVVDKFAGKVYDDAFTNKTWLMHTNGKTTIEKNSFTITAANGATMKGTFIAPAQVQIGYEPSKEGGAIRATGGSQFFVVMTVQQGEAPEVKISGVDLDARVQVGKQEISFEEDRIVLKH